MVDYNWAGRHKVDEEPLRECVPLDVQDKIEAYISNCTASSTSNTTYARYPVFMSDAIDWPAGVGPRDYILPWHDWDMLDKLLESQASPSTSI